MDEGHFVSRQHESLLHDVLLQIPVDRPSFLYIGRIQTGADESINVRIVDPRPVELTAPLDLARVERKEEGVVGIDQVVAEPGQFVVVVGVAPGGRLVGHDLGVVVEAQFEQRRLDELGDFRVGTARRGDMP